MKKYALSLFIVLLDLVAFAQYSYIPFPTKDSYWLHSSTDRYSRMYTLDQLMMNGEDTIIKGVQYTKITRRTAYDNGRIAIAPDFYYGAFREDGKKTYLWKNNDTAERLAYDFNLKPNDTVVCYMMGRGTIAKVDTILVAGKLRRQYTTSPFIGNIPYTIIEGFGGPYGIDVAFGYAGTYAYKSLITFHSGADNYCKPACDYIHPYGTPLSIANASDKLPAFIQIHLPIRYTLM